MADFMAFDLLPSIFNMSVTAGIVILFVLLIRLLLRKAPKIFSYVLWSVVLFRLLCPISLTAGFSLLGLVNTPAREATAHTTAVAYVQPDVVRTGSPQDQLPSENGNAPPDMSIPGEARVPSAPMEFPAAAAAGVWLLGGLAMLLYSIAAYVRTRRRLIGAVLMRDNIYLADYISSPFVMGIFRPKIYLPSALSAQEQTYIIRHEQYHIRRLDHIVKALSFAALCIHWFNPLVWAAFILSGKDMEMSCDEAVVKALGTHIRADYSASLLSLSTGRRMIAGTPLAFGEGDAKARIRNLVHWRTPKRWVVVLAATVCIAATAACVANPQEIGSGGDGRFASMEDFAQQTMKAAKTVSYYTGPGEQATATVTAAKLAWLDKRGTVDGLAPEGVLEAWTFNYLVQVDADDVLLVGGMSEEDGWYDMEGQGGRDIVSLRHEDGTYDILYNEVVNDGLNFYGYHNSYEEAVYDWYVTEKGLDLPLYVEDWTERVGTGEIMGNFPVHRYDGDGWYLYVPVSAWDRADAYGDSWQSGYGTGSALTVYRQDHDARAQADYLVSQGWIEVAGTVPHVRHWESDIEDYYFDAPDGGSYQVRIEWQAQNITDYPFIAIEPAVLKAMAESFTVDGQISAAPDREPRPGLLGGVQEGDPLELRLTRGSGGTEAYGDCWSVSNANYYFNGLQTAAWNAVEAAPDFEGKDAVTLTSDTWTLTAYADVEQVYFTDAAGGRWLVPDGYEEASVYRSLRGWFDEAEYAALGGGYNNQSLVIPDEGQGYLKAAGAYAEALERIHLQAAEGSKFCYSYVTTEVAAAEETTAALRAQGEIEENAYCFYLTTVFVPQNEEALHWSMAGNTGEYSGSDPAVPDGAMEYSRCGYITLENDGWHGELVGTGW